MHVYIGKVNVFMYGLMQSFIKIKLSLIDLSEFSDIMIKKYPKVLLKY